MEKEKLKLSYENAELKVLRFSEEDIVTASGYGTEGEDDLGWT